MTESWGELNSHGQAKTGLEWAIGRLEVKIPRGEPVSPLPVWFLASDKKCGDPSLGVVRFARASAASG